MTAENNEQIPSMLPSIKKNGDQLASASSTKSRRPLNEKIVYRKMPNLGTEAGELENYYDHAECPRCHSVISIKVNKNKENNNNDDTTNKAAVSRKSKARLSREQVMNDAASLISSCTECQCEKANKAAPALERSNSPRKYTTHLKKGKLYRSVDHGIDWTDLNEKIEDWFEAAKTPDQKVVYHFLNDIKHEEDLDDTSSVYSEKMTSKVKSLEGILDNLKKYRHKFQHPTNFKSAGLPRISGNKNTKSNSKLDNLFESSTWRVMRHIRSADVRNKYPLPKANPDEYFRNSTVFHVAGRVPNSTFLLHPEWV